MDILLSMNKEEDVRCSLRREHGLTRTLPRLMSLQYSKSVLTINMLIYAFRPMCQQKCEAAPRLEAPTQISSFPFMPNELADMSWWNLSFYT